MNEEYETRARRVYADVGIAQTLSGAVLRLRRTGNAHRRMASFFTASTGADRDPGVVGSLTDIAGKT